MNLKNKLRKFFTLSRQHEAGFTLIELIVVIAILGILGGVAVPVYSGYMKKANMATDQALVSDVAKALQMYYYDCIADGTEMGNGYIVLSANGVENEADIAEGSALDMALDAAYGDGWRDTLKLEYDGWLGVTSDQIFAEAYKASSYNGNEDALISQIGSVTNMLKDALGANTGLVGTSFNNYLTENGVNTRDNQAVSNAAILYAADTIGNMDAAQETAVNAAFAAFYDPQSSSYGNKEALTMSLKGELGIFGAVAAIYAHGEAFGQYVAANGNSELLEEYHQMDVTNVADTEAALLQVANNLETMVQKAKTDPIINPFALKYIGEGQYADDVTAYLEAMKKIDANADKFTDKLGSEGCYTDGTAAALLQAAVAVGSLGISCENGEVVIWIFDGMVGNTISGIQD